MTPEAFIKRYQYPVILATLGTGFFPSVKMAQACIETGYGKSIPENNLFGIKAKGNYTPYWKGATISAGTREVISGQSVTITDGFRAYETMSDSIKDHSYFIQQQPRYAKVLTATTPEAQARELQAAGYATDPNYGAALISIINKYDLKKLDKKKRIMKTGTIIMSAALLLAAAIYFYKTIQ